MPTAKHAKLTILISIATASLRVAILPSILLPALNKCFPFSNWWHVVESGTPDEHLDATVTSGKVVLAEFHGYNDLRGKVVMDFGSGTAGKSLHYARQGALRTVGVDVRIDHAAYAVSKAREERLLLEVCQIEDGYRLPLPNGSVDVVLSSSVLEHIPDLDASLREVKRVLKPGGLFLNRWQPYRTRFGSHLNQVIGIPFAHYLFGERALMRYYHAQLIRQFGRVPDVVGQVHDRSTFDDIIYLNRISTWQAHETFARVGFWELERRFYRGMRPIAWAAALPEAVRPLVVDYEVNILQVPQTP